MVEFLCGLIRFLMLTVCFGGDTVEASVVIPIDEWENSLKIFRSAEETEESSNWVTLCICIGGVTGSVRGEFMLNVLLAAAKLVLGAPNCRSRSSRARVKSNPCQGSAASMLSEVEPKAAAAAEVAVAVVVVVVVLALVVALIPSFVGVDRVVELCCEAKVVELKVKSSLEWNLFEMW